MNKLMTSLESLTLACVGIALMLSGCGSKTEGTARPGTPQTNPPRAELMRIPDELRSPSQVSVSQAAIDIVNEVGPSKITAQERVFRAKRDSPMWIRGWAYDDTHNTTPNRVWIELTGKESHSRFFIPADRMERPDIASGFKLPWARMAGFASPVVQDHNIPPASYDVKVYQIEGQVSEITKYYAVPSVTIIVE